MPVPLWARAREHGEGLIREMQLLAGDTDASSAPARLVTLARELSERYAGLSATVQQQLEAALDRGEASADLRLDAPAEAADACAALGAMLDEVDEFCREGHLLTLATPPEAVAFRRWYLGEFIRQLGGEPPVPWPDWQRREVAG